MGFAVYILESPTQDVRKIKLLEIIVTIVTAYILYNINNICISEWVSLQ
jgi:hypothetical protein